MEVDSSDISVRACLRALPGQAVPTLGGMLLAWGIVRWTHGPRIPLWGVLAAWPVFTVGFGPLMWVRDDLRPRRPSGRSSGRWWAALGLAMLWAVVVVPLLGILLFELVVTVFGIDL